MQSKAQKEIEIGNVQPLKVVDQIVATIDATQSVQTKLQKEKDTVKVQDSNVVNQVADITEVTKDVQMRFQEEKQKGKIKFPKVANQIADITLVEIKEAQNGDETLSVPIRTAESGEKKAAKNGSIRPYLDENNILYKEFQSQQIEHGKLFKQPVVPIEYREHSLRLENDPILSEHLGLTQMTDKIEAESHWPGVQQDHIRHYCSSLDVCKRRHFKGKILKMPIIDMPLIQVDTPFVGAAIVRLFLTILVITFLAVVYLQSITMEKQNVFVFLIRGILSHNCDSFETTHIWDHEFL